jgi:two-component system response regulator HydG
LRLATSTPEDVGDLLLGKSAATQKLRSVIARVAPSDASVVIVGESGVGKELVARALHRSSTRGGGPFVALNCAAVPAELLESELFGHEKGAFTDARSARPGLFVQANGGTLFLDEIGEMPVSLQPKLLRALQERRVRPLGGTAEVAVDVRVVAATNRDLTEAVHRNVFREDLLFRLDVVRIVVPPLRERRQDVAILADYFLDRGGSRGRHRIEGLTQRAREALTAYDWPGNVRELENSMERACALARGAVIDLEDLPDNIRAFKPSSIVIADGAPESFVMWDELERRYVLKVIETCRGNKSEAARILGIDRRTLYRKLERWGEDAGEPEPQRRAFGP